MGCRCRNCKCSASRLRAGCFIFYIILGVNYTEYSTVFLCIICDVNILISNYSHGFIAFIILQLASFGLFIYFGIMLSDLGPTSAKQEKGYILQIFTSGLASISAPILIRALYKKRKSTCFFVSVKSILIQVQENIIHPELSYAISFDFNKCCIFTG